MAYSKSSTYILIDIDSAITKQTRKLLKLNIIHVWRHGAHILHILNSIKKNYSFNYNMLLLFVIHNCLLQYFYLGIRIYILHRIRFQIKKRRKYCKAKNVPGELPNRSLSNFNVFFFFFNTWKSCHIT